jgi:hypothetical protein
VEQSVHGADRAEVDARGEQLGVDLGGWLVEEAGAVERVKNFPTNGFRDLA